MASGLLWKPFFVKLVFKLFIFSMHFKAVAIYKPFISPKAKLGFILFISFVALLKCIREYLEYGLSQTFFLLGGLALTAVLLEWKHYNKPKEIILEMIEGRLEYTNMYTGERHTVYKSRIEWMKIYPDMIVFFSVSSISTKIPVKYFSREQISNLFSYLESWDIKTHFHEENGKDILPAG